MNKETKTKYRMALLSIFVGIYLCLEGFGVTHFGKAVNNTPVEIIILSGIIFLLAGIMILIGKNKMLNNFLASVLILIMGLIMGWISLFADPASFSGSGVILSKLTGLPLGKIMFGFGSIICFVISAIAFRKFLNSDNS